MMTSDEIWDPTVYDVDIDPNSTAFLASNPEQLHKLPTPDFNMTGDYIIAKKLLQNGTIEFDELISGELFGDFHLLKRFLQEELGMNPYWDEFLKVFLMMSVVIQEKYGCILS